MENERISTKIVKVLDFSLTNDEKGGSI